MKRWLATLALASALTVVAHAQDVPEGHPPLPADELPPGHPQVPADDLPPGHPQVPADDLPPGHPQVPADDLPPGHPQMPGEGPDTGESPHGDAPAGHAHDPAMDATIERAFREPRVASAEPDPSLPAGQIRVRVVDERGAPLPDHDVQLGVMRQGGDRERTPGRTDATGVFTYTDLPTGSGQAYRVNVPHEGATYSCTPFQLPTAMGYSVRVEARPVVRSDRSLLLVLGQTMVELRDERLHVIQQARLSNLASATYLFPEGGTRIELPEGYLNFQTQPVMTDQRVVELTGQGLRIEGSLPTGQVTLAWAFDLPVTGDEMEIEIPNPFRTFQYRVISTAPQGMGLDVADMPTPVRFEDQGQPLLGTEIQRSPDQPALASVRIRLHGIPGPSPVRLYALAIASLFGLFGLVLIARRPYSDHGRSQRSARRKELLLEAARLEADAAAGEIGPETRQSRRAAIVRELAVLFYLDERMDTEAPAAGPTTSKKASNKASDKASTKSTKRAEARKETTTTESTARNGEDEPPKKQARAERER